MPSPYCRSQYNDRWTELCVQLCTMLLARAPDICHGPNLKCKASIGQMQFVLIHGVPVDIATLTLGMLTESLDNNYTFYITHHRPLPTPWTLSKTVCVFKILLSPTLWKCSRQFPLSRIPLSLHTPCLPLASPPLLHISNIQSL